jgi:hypothetical protein
MVGGPGWMSFRSEEERLMDLRAAIARLEEDDRKASENIDRAVLVGGTAAVIASATFLGEIASQPAPGSLFLLRSSWISFLAGAGFAFASFFTTRVAARAYRRVLEKQITKGGDLTPEDYDPVRKPNAITRLLTRMGVAGFILGTVLLTGFAERNLPTEGHVEEVPSEDQAFSTFLDSLRSACKQRNCVLVFGYDYDLPRRTDPPKRDTTVVSPTSPPSLRR